MTDAVIYDGIRSPFGRFGGGLSVKRPDDLAAAVIRALLDRNGIESSLVEDVVLGNTNQAGEDSRNVARNAALLAGMHTSVGGVTVNRLCGSGAAATLDAARAISCGQGQLFISGGVESMSRSPWVLGKAETGFDRNQQMYDSLLGWRFRTSGCSGSTVTNPCRRLRTTSPGISISTGKTAMPSPLPPSKNTRRPGMPGSMMMNLLK